MPLLWTKNYNNECQNQIHRYQCYLILTLFSTKVVDSIGDAFTNNDGIINDMMQVNP